MLIFNQNKDNIGPNIVLLLGLEHTNLFLNKYNFDLLILTQTIRII